eukprot:1090222-Pelagomonas_calceolata.AAC.2
MPRAFKTLYKMPRSGAYSSVHTQPGPCSACSGVLGPLEGCQYLSCNTKDIRRGFGSCIICRVHGSTVRKQCNDLQIVKMCWKQERAGYQPAAGVEYKVAVGLRKSPHLCQMKAALSASMSNGRSIGQ